MDFPKSRTPDNDVPGHSLPKFSDIRTPAPKSMNSAISWIPPQAQDPLYAEHAALLNYMPPSPILNSPNKLATNLLYMCKMRLNNVWNIMSPEDFDAQLNSSPANAINSELLPSLTQSDAFSAKQEFDVPSKGQINLYKSLQEQAEESAVKSIKNVLYTKCLQSSLEEAIKLQTEQMKKEEKTELSQNNILNIPNVVRNIQCQNGSNFIMNSNRILRAANLSDLNIHIENEQQENESNLQTVLKVEQQVQTDFPNPAKRPKFRAKLGEVKVSINYDGSMLYYCPECNFKNLDKMVVEQHIQLHLQERKYQCKECGAMLKRKEHLDQHMRGHSNERPYKCPVCQSGFKRNEHLTRHSVIHSGDKNFPCTMCQKAFSRKDHLNKHKQTHLSTRKNKPKQDSYFMEQKETAGIFDKSIDAAVIPKQEVSYIMKDNDLQKQESLLQQIQILQNDPNMLHTLTSFQEQMMRDADILQQAPANNIKLLPQNRYRSPL